ncbi:MAG TPA: PilZ domain-containing protein [Syntrophomonadaceae bacterium]|nr:PilZ domain-containing protein [Syntrophomonadaceae bacterium]
MSWEEFTTSLNQAFSNKNVFTFENILFFLLVLILCLIIIYIVRYEAIKTNIKRRIAYQETRKRLFKKRSLSQDSNKRDWYRIETDIPFKWYPLPIPTYIQEKNFYDAIAIDISGGGLLFYTHEIATLNEEILLLLNLDGTSLQLIAQILRVQTEERDGEKYYLTGVKFTSIREGQRNKIISWILKSQAEDILKQETESDPEIPTEEIMLPQQEIPSPAKEIWEKIISEQNVVFSGTWQGEEVDLLFRLNDYGLINLKGMISGDMKEDQGKLTINIEIHSQEF